MRSWKLLTMNLLARMLVACFASRLGFRRRVTVSALQQPERPRERGSATAESNIYSESKPRKLVLLGEDKEMWNTNIYSFPTPKSTPSRHHPHPLTPHRRHRNLIIPHKRHLFYARLPQLHLKSPNQRRSNQIQLRSRKFNPQALPRAFVERHLEFPSFPSRFAEPAFWVKDKRVGEHCR